MGIAVFTFVRTRCSPLGVGPMTRSLSRLLCVLLLPAVPALLHGAAAPPRPQGPSAGELAEFRTVETAITARIGKPVPSATPAQPGYLGIHVANNADGKPVVAQIDP